VKLVSTLDTSMADLKSESFSSVRLDKYLLLSSESTYPSKIADEDDSFGTLGSTTVGLMGSALPMFPSIRLTGSAEAGSASNAKRKAIIVDEIIFMFPPKINLNFTVPHSISRDDRNLERRFKPVEIHEH
jgi:hypothetical protein